MSRNPAKATNKNPLSIITTAHGDNHSPNFALIKFTPAGLIELAGLRESFKELPESFKEIGGKQGAKMPAGSKKGFSVNWMEDFSIGTLEDSVVLFDQTLLDDKEAMDVDWEDHAPGPTVDDRLVVCRDGFWLEARIKDIKNSSIESSLVAWSDIDGLSERLDTIMAAVRNDETAALRRRVAELEAALEESRKAADFAADSVFVLCRENRHGDRDRRAFRSEKEAESCLADEIRGEWDGPPSMESMDDRELISLYQQQKVDETVWIEEVSVEGARPPAPSLPQPANIVAVAIHKVDDSFDVQAYPSLDEAQAGLAAKLRGWKDGFWKEGEAERLDDVELIDEYARRNGHEELWLGPVAVMRAGQQDGPALSGGQPSLGAAADGQAGGKPKILITVRDGVVYGWDTNMDADGLAVAVFDQDAFDAGDNWEIPPGFEGIAPQWLKNLLDEREDAGDGPAM